jgi:hypothetical protein
VEKLHRQEAVLMSNGLPTFQQQVALQPVAAQPATGLEEVSQALSTFSSRVASIGSKLAVQQAKIRGTTEGAQEELHLKKPTTLPEIEEYNAAVASHNSVVASDVRNHVQLLHMKYMTTESGINSLQNFQKEVKDWFNGYSANLDPQFKAIATKAFNLYGGTAQLSLARHVSTLVKSTNSVEAKIGLHQTLQDAISLAHEGKPNEAAQLYSAAVANVAPSATNGTLSPALLGQISNGVQKLHYESYVGEYRLAKNANKGAEFIHRIMNDKSLNDVDRHIILAKCFADNNFDNQKKNFMEKSWKQEAQDNLTQQALKGAPHNILVQDALDKVAPAAGKEFSKAANSAQVFNQFKDAAVEQDPETFKANLAEIPKSDVFSPVMRQALVDFNGQQNALFKKDPAAFAEKTEFYKKALLQTTTTAGFESLPPEDKNLLMTRAGADAVLNYQRSRNISEENLEILPQNRINKIVRTLENVPLEQRPEQIAGFISQFSPQQRPVVERQFKKVMPSVNSWVYDIAANPDSAPQLLSAFSAFQQNLPDLLKIKGITATKLESSINSDSTSKSYMDVLSEFGSTSLNAINDYKTHLRKLAATLTGDDSDTSKAVQNASAIMLAGKEFESFNGHPLYFNKYPNLVNDSINQTTPLQMNWDKVHNALNYMFDTARNDQDMNISPTLNDKLRNLPTKEFKNSAIEHQMTDAHFLPLQADGNKLYLVDKHGFAITHGSDKQKYILDLTDLTNPMSKINRQIAQYNVDIAQKAKETFAPRIIPRIPFNMSVEQVLFPSEIIRQKHMGG